MKHQSVTGSDQVRLSFQDVLALSTAPGNQPKRGGRQHLLSQLMDNAIRKRFKLSLTPKHLAWFNSVSSKTAGSWLNVLPKNDTTTFKPDEFVSLVSYRLSLRQPELCEGLRCDCTIRGEHPVIDDHGRHLVTGCKKQGMSSSFDCAHLHSLQDSEPRLKKSGLSSNSTTSFQKPRSECAAT